jgi:hypothetical protein
MIKGMRKVPENVAEPWHGSEEEEPKYLKPFRAAAKYANSKRRTNAYAGVVVGAVIGGAPVVFIRYTLVGLLTWVGMIVLAVAALGIHSMVRLQTGLKARELALEAERGIKIIEPKADEKKEKAA